MRSVTKGIAISVASVFLLVPAVLACGEKGTMEKAGEKMDDAVDKIAHPNEGPVEKAGRKTDEAFESAKDKLED